VFRKLRLGDSTLTWRSLCARRRFLSHLPARPSTRLCLPAGGGAGRSGAAVRLLLSLPPSSAYRFASRGRRPGLVRSRTGSDSQPVLQPRRLGTPRGPFPFRLKAPVNTFVLPRSSLILHSWRRPWHMLQGSRGNKEKTQKKLALSHSVIVNYNTDGR